VLAIGNQALMPMLGKQCDAVGTRVMPEEKPGQADLVAAAGAEHLLIEPGPVLDRRAPGVPKASGGCRRRTRSH